MGQFFPKCSCFQMKSATHRPGFSVTGIVTRRRQRLMRPDSALPLQHVAMACYISTLNESWWLNGLPRGGGLAADAEFKCPVCVCAYTVYMYIHVHTYVIIFALYPIYVCLYRFVLIVTICIRIYIFTYTYLHIHIYTYTIIHLYSIYIYMSICMWCK